MKLKANIKYMIYALLIISILIPIFLFWNSYRHNNVLVFANQVPITIYEFNKHIYNASKMNAGHKSKSFLKTSFEGMINGELLAQEAKKRYGEMPRKEAIDKLFEEEIKKKVTASADASKIDRKKAELARYQEYVADLRARAEIKYFCKPEEIETCLE